MRRLSEVHYPERVVQCPGCKEQFIDDLPSIRPSMCPNATCAGWALVVVPDMPHRMPEQVQIIGPVMYHKNPWKNVDNYIMGLAAAQAEFHRLFIESTDDADTPIVRDVKETP